MKKLIFLMVMFLAAIASAETSKYGSMWKQEDTTLSPADDVVYVDFSGYTTVGAGGGSPFTNITVTGVAVIEKITGGDGSINGGTDSFIGGGLGNETTATRDAIVGGSGNSTYGSESIVLNGNSNSAQKPNSFIGNGSGNTIAGNGSTSTILNGVNNYLAAPYGIILNGWEQDIFADYGVLMGRYGKLDSAADRSFGDIYADSQVTVSTPNVHIVYGAAGYEKKIGIQTLTPRYELDVVGDVGNSGSVLFEGMTTVLGNYSVALGDYTVFANASIAASDLYLPDATTVEGIHIRFKKKDVTENHVTINATGGQNIDGNGSKVLEQTNNAIMLYSNGSNWEVLQATSVAHYGEMHVHDNSTATPIDTSGTHHLIQGLFIEEDTGGFTFTAGLTGSISAFAEYSTVVPGTTKVTDVGHGLSSGAILSISGTTSYNDVFEATVIDTDNYYIVDTFVADDATGNWYEGDSLTNNTGKTGKFKVDFHGFGTSGGNNKIFHFDVYRNGTKIENLESKRFFATSTDVGSLGSSGLVTIADGDIITLAIVNETDAIDFTFEHINVVIHSF